jgi:hypothetical protein
LKIGIISESLVEHLALALGLVYPLSPVFSRFSPKDYGPTAWSIIVVRVD